MKTKNVRIRLAALAAALLLALPGCGRQEAAAEPPAAPAPAPEASAGAAPKETGTLVCVMDRQDEIAMLCGGFPDGFYLNDAPRGYDAQGCNLTYFDYAAGEQRILCDQPDCAHDTADCVSYMEGAAIVFVVGDELYVIDCVNMTLQRRALDGSGVQILAENVDTFNLEKIYYDGRKLYFINRYAPTLIVDLEEGTTSQSSWPGELCMPETQTWQGKILVHIYEQGGVPSACTLGIVSPEDGSLTELHRWEKEECSGRLFFKDDECFYIEPATGRLMALSLTDDTVREVSDAFCQYNVPQKAAGTDGEADYYPAGDWYGWMQGEWLCVAGADTDEEAGVIRSYLCNVETGEVRPLSLTYYSHYYERPVWALGETEYGLLVLQEQSPLTLHLLDSEGQPLTTQTTRPVYALIDWQDLLDGVPAFRTLTPLPIANAS